MVCRSMDLATTSPCPSMISGSRCGSYHFCLNKTILHKQIRSLRSTGFIVIFAFACSVTQVCYAHMSLSCLDGIWMLIW
jgi:hypothetical protein